MKLSTATPIRAAPALALYAFLLWRMPYSMKHFSLRVSTG